MLPFSSPANSRLVEMFLAQGLQSVIDPASLPPESPQGAPSGVSAVAAGLTAATSLQSIFHPRFFISTLGLLTVWDQ